MAKAGIVKLYNEYFWQHEQVDGGLRVWVNMQTDKSLNFPISTHQKTFEALFWRTWNFLSRNSGICQNPSPQQGSHKWVYNKGNGGDACVGFVSLPFWKLGVDVWREKGVRTRDGKRAGKESSRLPSLWGQICKMFFLDMPRTSKSSCRSSAALGSFNSIIRNDIIQINALHTGDSSVVLVIRYFIHFKVN